MTVPIAIIVAVAENGVIGRDGDMPWKLSTDLKRFKAITMGNPIVMGRKTFDSIGRVLPGRQNIVITRNAEFKVEGVKAVASLEEAIEVGRQWAIENDAKEISILGGGEIFRQSLKLADRLYYTKVKASLEGDTHFPEINLQDWRVSHEENLPSGPKDNFETKFIIYEKR